MNIQIGSSGPQPTFVVQTAPGSTTGINHALAVKTARVLGVSHIICGIIIVLCQVTATVITEEYDLHRSSSVAGTGIWCGLFIIINGILGCYSASHKTNGIIISFLVFSVFCGFLFAPIMIGVTGGDLGMRSWNFCSGYNYDYYGSGRRDRNCDLKDAMVALNAVMLLASFLEFVFSMWTIGITSVAIRKTNGCGCCCQCCYDTSVSPQNMPVILYMPANTQIPSMVNTGIAAPQQGAAFDQLQQGVPFPQMAQMQNGVSLPQMQQGFPLPYMQQSVEAVQQVPPSYSENFVGATAQVSDPPAYKI